MKYRILVVEDNPLNRELLCDWLESEGHEVLSAEDLAAARHVLTNQQRDVVLLDVQLGDRRWPAGLHTAIEAKEAVAPKVQGKVLGSITLQNLIALYPRVCMTSGPNTLQQLPNFVKGFTGFRGAAEIHCTNIS